MKSTTSGGVHTKDGSRERGCLPGKVRREVKEVYME
jgi:hypothetical protein